MPGDSFAVAGNRLFLVIYEKYSYHNVQFCLIVSMCEIQKTVMGEYFDYQPALRYGPLTELVLY